MLQHELLFLKVLALVYAENHYLISIDSIIVKYQAALIFNINSDSLLLRRRLTAHRRCLHTTPACDYLLNCNTLVEAPKRVLTL